MAEVFTVFTGTFGACLLNKYLDTSDGFWPLPNVDVRFALHLFDDQTLDMESLSWPPLFIRTDDGDPLFVGFRSSRRGTYFTLMDIDGATGTRYSKYFLTIPMTVSLDFFRDPVIGHKDQDCDLQLSNTGVVQTPLDAEGVFGGSPSSANDYSGANVRVFGVADVDTWGIWSPIDSESHNYRLGVLAEGSFSPSPPREVAAPLTVIIRPHPVPLNVLTTVTVSANDPTGAPVAGDVVIDGGVVGHSNVAFQYLFKTRLIRLRHRDPATGRIENEPVEILPRGVLRVPGRADIPLNWES